MTIPRVNSAQTLETQGNDGPRGGALQPAGTALMGAAIKRGEGRLGLGGTFLVSTGQVYGPVAERQVRSSAAPGRSKQPGLVGQTTAPWSPRPSENRLYADMLEPHEGRRNTSFRTLYVGADPELRSRRAGGVRTWPGTTCLSDLLRRPAAEELEARARVHHRQLPQLSRADPGALPYGAAATR